MLGVVLVLGSVALVTGVGSGASSGRPNHTIEEIAQKAGCRVSEFNDLYHNPPVSGHFVERNRAKDGSYVGRRSPSLPATIHSL
jgi:hypothetical protein